LPLSNSPLAASAQRPPAQPNAAEILHKMQKLNVLGSVLYIVAHPDDENTRLIAWLANGKKVRTGNLSLTRGDGGQNLIGPELGDALGIIRTQELMEARRIDGGEQFFTRAVDFGYSKNAAESFEKWGKQEVLSDVVRVIRLFRPDVIITRFAPDRSAGHGHHEASAILAEEAFDLAGDPKAFPEQLEQGLEVWQPRRLFFNGSTWWKKDLADIAKSDPDWFSVDVGGYDPLLGLSYTEIAGRSRSMHKSQGFGAAETRGESLEYLKLLIKGDRPKTKDIFEGIDMTWGSTLLSVWFIRQMGRPRGRRAHPPGVCHPRGLGDPEDRCAHRHRRHADHHRGSGSAHRQPHRPSST
jgi:LmbE family N-acetylglucosaminyl deacetylase